MPRNIAYLAPTSAGHGLNGGGRGMCYNDGMRHRARLGHAYVAVAALALSLTANPFAGSWGVAPAQAHSYVEISVDYLAKHADRVTVVDAEDEMSVWENEHDGKRIVTYHRLRVQSDLIGEGDAEIWVRTLGGVVGKIGQRVHGAAPIRRGQPFLLFLARRSDGNFAVIGMEQGCFPVSIAKDRKMTVGMRTIQHAPVPTQLEAQSASILEGRPIDEVKRIVLEARRTHAQ